MSGLHSAIVAGLLALSVGPCTPAPEAPEVATVPLVLLLPIPEVCEDIPIVESCDPEPCCAGERFDELRAEVAAECAAMKGDRLEVGRHGCDAQCKLHDGRNHGPAVGWYNRGSVESKMFYRQGQPIDPIRTWYENGQPQRETWLAGPTSCTRTWNESGELTHDDCLAFRAADAE